MKKDGTHPEYRDVLFIDSSTGHKFVIGSTLKSDETEVFEGKEYPLCRVSTSSASHPIYTGDTNKLLDTEGRVGKFRKRYERSKQQEAE
ncbi:MAG: type B 50S ribosomal protein L31 [Waddliaceae bacterium]